MTISVGGNGRMAGMFQPMKAPITLTEAAASRVRELVTRPGDDGVVGLRVGVKNRSEEHTSELQSLMRISYAVFCLNRTPGGCVSQETNQEEDTIPTH